jgi:hypothetical protein
LAFELPNLTLSATSSPKLSTRFRTASPRRARYQSPTVSRKGTMTPPPSGSWRQGQSGGQEFGEGQGQSMGPALSAAAPQQGERIPTILIRLTTKPAGLGLGRGLGSGFRGGFSWIHWEAYERGRGFCENDDALFCPGLL